MPTTLVDFFRGFERRTGEFLVYDDGYRVHRHTYADVARAARGFAARLSSSGVTKGDKVVFWGENRPEWVACFWGCLIAGVIVVPVDYRASADFLGKVRRIVRARIVLVGDDVTRPDAWDPGTANRLRKPPASLAEAQRAKAEPVPSIDDAEVLAWRFADFDWSADGPMPLVSMTADDITQIVFTSGATAEPKGVVIRHRNILANVVPVEREVAKYTHYIRLFSPLRFLNLLPLSHLFGQSMATNIPPMVNGTVFFMRSFNPVDIARLVKQRRISVIVCVPKILEVLREHAIRVDPGAADPPSGLSIPARWWRYRKIHRALGLKFWAFVVGAAPLGPALEDFWKRLGFVVIQGYGLTETAPIVTLNHPFRTNTGSVGTPIGGVEVKIAEDGEILVRGENVTSGYYEDTGSRESAVGSRQSAVAGPVPGLPTPDSRLPTLGRTLDEEGWLHTGDVGELDKDGRLFIRGRKKEMIVTPEGLNVFPDDVEAVLNRIAGVKESAVVASAAGAEERVHAVLVLDRGVEPEAVVAEANRSLQDHQRVRGVSVWPGEALPRTEGTKKLKRQAVREWVATGTPMTPTSSSEDALQGLLEKFAGAREMSGSTSLEQLGLSSLERVELMVALEDKYQTRLDEGKFAEARTIDELRALVAQAPEQTEVIEPVDFPSWNRHPLVGLIRRLSLATWILPLARVFAWLDVRGLEHLRNLRGPVVFAANHQSHFDVPVILAALPGHIRKTVAPAMAKEFFKEHFFPEGQPWRRIFIKRLNYYLAAFFFNAFPLPQREAGARQTLRYIGEITADGFSVLIFPEGRRAADADIQRFQGGIGMIGSRLALPIVPVRIQGVDRILHTTAKMARPGRVTVAFGAPIRLTGEDYAAEAARVEAAVKALG